MYKSDSRRAVRLKYRLIDGQLQRPHPAGCVATTLGKSVDTIRRGNGWESCSGTPYVPRVAGSEHGRRLYTDKQLELIGWAAERSGVRGRKPFELGETDFASLLQAAWSALFPTRAA